MLIAGLTGGIASGKSTVSAMFHQAGATIIDADVIARQIVYPETTAWKRIVDAFGQQVVLPDGHIDRTRLGDIVFQDDGMRRTLEQIVHPGVRAEIKARLDSLRRTTPHAVVIQDVPLLLETGMTDGLDEIMVVYVPLPVQLERLIKRDHLSPGDARLRIDAQMPLEEKRHKATIIIDNSADRESTHRQVQTIFSGFVARARSEV